MGLDSGQGANGLPDYMALAEGFQDNFKQVEELLKDFSNAHKELDFDAFNLTDAYTAWMEALVKDPQKIIDANIDLWQKSIALSTQAFTSFWGQAHEQTSPVIQAQKGDRRFRHDAWTEQPVFDAVKQSYLLGSQWLRNLVTDVEGLDEKTSEKVKFFTERYLDAMSPTNFALTNPEVLDKAIETKGANLVQGVKNMFRDLETGSGQLKIRMTDPDAFELGKNVGTTPGKVVFQNRMFQLIQYSPTTDKVLKRPLLIVPPWINKFYILDLQPKNSMLKWLTDQGHTVFVMSWVNPDQSYNDADFGTYVTEGIVKAVDAVEVITGESEINAAAYCIGGTLLSTTLAYMKGKGDKRVQSATLFTTMLDFSDPGELGVFIDEGQVCGLEKKMDEDGYLDGGAMAGAFNLLRANDLIWSFYINNYLMGNEARPFDLLYWNSDSTRMPPLMHSFYLRNMYLENNLAKPNGVTIDGVKIDLSSIDVPTYFISTIEDHIAPWTSTYKGAKLFSGDVRFVLGGSGHIAGIVNPPAAGKYNYRVTDEVPADGEKWAKEAKVTDGSWWPNWDEWLRAKDSTLVDARVPGEGPLPVIEDAPGTYVTVKMDQDVPKVEFTSLDVKPAKPAKKAAAKKPAAKKEAAEKKAPAKKAPAKKAAGDDLTKINGIGPVLAKLFIDQGISTYAQVAEMTGEAISDMLVKLDEKNKRFDTSDWPAQAKKLKG